MTSTQTLSGERADLLDTLAQHRFFLRNTTRDLTGEQAGRRTTVSALCLGGLIKHVAHVEEVWVRFIESGPKAMTGNGKAWSEWTGEDYAQRETTFQMLPGETLTGVLAHYQDIARHTDELIATHPDLDLSQPLPDAPWYPPGTSWTVRRALVHILAEIAQHAGHADIIREALDGAKTMG
ncbi:MAG: DinB family protein [Pseudonocardiaceae bacterium]